MKFILGSAQLGFKYGLKKKKINDKELDKIHEISDEENYKNTCALYPGEKFLSKIAL